MRNISRYISETVSSSLSYGRITGSARIGWRRGSVARILLYVQRTSYAHVMLCTYSRYVPRVRATQRVHYHNINNQWECASRCQTKLTVLQLITNFQVNYNWSNTSFHTPSELLNCCLCPHRLMDSACRQRRPTERNPWMFKMTLYRVVYSRPRNLANHTRSIETALVWRAPTDCVCDFLYVSSQ